MKKGIRLYINITNKCNTNCPFCCMYSSTEKNTFMSFDVFKKIIDENILDDGFELQLEGGEPLLHPNLYLFIEYAISTNKCNKIIILTNGLASNFEFYLKRLLDIHNAYDIPIELKISVNYWLLKENPQHIKNISMYVFSTNHIPDFSITLNVRKRKEKDENLDKIINDLNLTDISNIFYFQSYGKLTDSDYDKPVIIQNIENWKIFSCDGKCFDTDLIARSEYEKNLK